MVERWRKLKERKKYQEEKARKQGSKEERTMLKEMERERKRMQELLNKDARGMEVIRGDIIPDMKGGMAAEEVDLTNSRDITGITSKKFNRCFKGSKYDV
jgi:hypothetical protein